MNIRRFIDRLFSRSDSALVDLTARDADPGNILTIVSVVYSTAQKTFTGPAVYITQAGAPVATTSTTQASPTEQQSSSEAQETQDSQSSDDSDSMSSTAAVSSTDSSQQSSTSVESTSSVPTSAPSITMAPSPTQNAQSTALQNAATNSASPTTAASGGMSGGAKAGLAIGLLALFALLGFGAFYMYRRQKAKHESHERLDDEKMAMTQPDALPRHPEPEPMMMAAAPPRSQDVPRLSIRPMTQFGPNLAGDRRSNATGGAPPSLSTPDAMPAAAAATVAAAAAARKENSGLRKPGVSAWERPGAERNAANDPANPFGNHAETIDNASRPGTATTADAPVSATNVPTPAQTAIRAPSPGINPADFPLPTSVPPSPNSAIFGQNGSVQGKGSDGAAGAVAGVVAGTALVGTAEKKSPKKPAPAQGPVHRVQMDFIPSMEDELEIHTGQLLRIKHEYDDGWALCELMDGSKSGVVPRSCLSKAALQQRPANAPRQGLPARPGPQARGPQPNGPGDIPRPLTPGGGRNSPVPGGRASTGPGSMVPRPLTPTGRNSPAPYAQQQRQMSPVAGPSRARASSNASPYMAYQPTGRSMSPGPYGAGGLKPTPRPDNARRRSKSVSEMADIKASGAAPSPLIPARKPVGGHKPSGSS